MEILSKSEVVRRMRPLQRDLAERIIADVATGDGPRSIGEARDRYFKHIYFVGVFDTGQGWSGDFREAALWTLLSNGFAKGGAVVMQGEDLAWKIRDRDALTTAAQIEMVFGGNRARMTRSIESLAQVRVAGTGAKSVYLYTDSILDEGNLHFCKIGRHHYSELGLILGRIVQQYGTANPGSPILRYAFRTNEDAALERRLHGRFHEFRVDGTGSEWFRMSHEEVWSVAIDLMQDPV